MAIILVILFSVIFTLYFVFRNPWMQTITARMVADNLSKKLKTEISIGGFDLSVRNGLVIGDILVKDHADSVMFSAHKLGIRIAKFLPWKRILTVDKVFIDNGIFQLITHKGDSSLNLQYFIDFFASHDTTSKPDTALSKPWKLSVSSVELVSTRFHFADENQPKTDTGMDYTNIDVRNINLLITHFLPEGDTMNAEIKHLSAEERSGFAVRSLSGEFHVSPAFLKAKNLKVVTDRSNLDLDFEFLYKNWYAYNDFLNKITIHAHINPSVFDLREIGTFAPVMYRMKDRFHLSGDLKGTVANFKAKNFRVGYGSSTRFFGNISAIGLPDVEETFVDLKIFEFTTNKRDYETFTIPSGDGRLFLPELLKNAGNVTVKGIFTGFYNDFVSNARINTDIGEIQYNLALVKPTGKVPMKYKGEVDIRKFQLGNFLELPETMGSVTLRADLDGQGGKLENADLKMNVRVDSMYFYGYNYSHIDVHGSLAEKKFNGTLRVSDPNLLLDFQGKVDLHDSIPSFDFTSEIKKARLDKLRILTYDTALNLSALLNVKFTGSNIDNINGSIIIDSARYIRGPQSVFMEHFSFRTVQDKNLRKTYHLDSDFADADFTGAFAFSDLIPSLTGFINNYLASFRLKKSLISHHPSTNQVCNFHVKLWNTDSITAIFLPMLRIAPETEISGYYNEDNRKLEVNAVSPEINLYGSSLSEWFLHATTLEDELHLETGCSQFVFKKESKNDSSALRGDSLFLVSDLRQDTIHVGCEWKTGENRSRFKGFASFTAEPAITLSVTGFDVLVDKKRWNIANDNFVFIDTSSITFHDIEIHSGDEHIMISGVVSRNPHDTLEVSISKLDISHLDYFLGGKSLDIDGIMNGQVKLNDIYRNLKVFAAITIEKMKFNTELLGDARVRVLYDDADNRFDIDSKIIYTGNVGTNIPFSLTGSYYLRKPHPQLDFDLSLNNLNLKMIAPFVAGFMSGLQGRVSGDVRITGTIDKPVTHGKLNLMRTECKINYLNVMYSLSDVVTIDSNAFLFNRIQIQDSLGKKAYLSGKITHHYLKDFMLDLDIEADDFSAFDNTIAQNNIFYGKARGRGSIKISGPPDNIAIKLKVQTGGGTHVYIPISSTADISQNDFIVFEEKQKDTLMMTRKEKADAAKGVSLDMDLKVNPDAIVEVFLPNQIGSIKGSGKGNLSMNYTPLNGFSMLGTLYISKGTFIFHLQNLMRLTFSIRDGSMIRWTGDPADANIAVSAVYKTRVPLLGVVTDPEYNSVKIPVECIIRMNGKLMNPDITFSLNMPNVEEEIKTMVYSAIDTTNVSEMNQQMIYLLVMNQFKPVTGPGASVDLGSAPLSIATNQVNSWLSQVSHNVNVGINYQKPTSSTKEEFDVGVSTALFNDRLLIDGTFGMYSNKSSSQQQASTIVGDVNIEYILTRNRQWRIRAFNRTNNIESLNNNAPYTQGLGLSYQREFNRLADFFKSRTRKINTNDTINKKP